MVWGVHKKEGWKPTPSVSVLVNCDDTPKQPKNKQNNINLKGNQPISVAVLSTVTFDATSLDVSTIIFGPDDAQEIHSTIHTDDVNKDGINDALLHFNVQDTGMDDSTTELCLSGETTDGTFVEGCDTVNPVGKI